MKGFYISFVLLIPFCRTASAQQDAMYSQYMFNMLSVNPAYAGNRDAVTLTALKRWQWSTIEGAPQTANFAADLPLRNNRVGLGLLVVNDQIGVTKTNSANVSYSYKLKFKKRRTLALGIQGGFTNLRSNLLSLNATTDNDPVLLQNVDKWLPNFGAGVYYSTDNFYAGFSVPHMINSTIVDGAEPFLRQHYFLSTGYLIRPSENILIKPSLLVKYVKGAPLQADINANVWLYGCVGAGLSYRTGDAFVVMTEFLVAKQFCFGYAYDMTVSHMKNSTSGSHELLLRYQFGLTKNKQFTPKYF